MKKILVPIDGSDYSMKAIEKAKEIAKPFGAEVELLHVLHTTGHFVTTSSSSESVLSEIERQLKIHSEESLEEAKAAFKDTGISVTATTLDGYPPDVIVDYAQEHGFDLIIMGSNGLNSSFKRVFLGSVTNRVAHNATTPLLIVK